MLAKPMRVVRQREGLCLAACCAMLTNETLEDVEKAVGFRRRRQDETGLSGVLYLPDNLAIQYLAQRFLCYGARLTVYNVASNDESFTVSVSMLAPAILTVKSARFEGFDHAVVWDPDLRKVLDPQHDEPQDLASYAVTEWVPITEIGA